MEAFDWPGMTHPGSTKRKRPFGVTVLALVQVVSGIQMLGSGLWALAVASIAGTPEGAETLETTLSPWMAENAAAIFTVIGFSFLVLAILSFLLARGYVKGLEKARVRGRKVAFYSILFAILSIVLVPNRTDPGSPWWTILINVTIYFYLNSDKVKGYFKKSG